MKHATGFSEVALLQLMKHATGFSEVALLQLNQQSKSAISFSWCGLQSNDNQYTNAKLYFLHYTQTI
jgi:hypothetical protein